jgi:exoribonuclease II
MNYIPSIAFLATRNRPTQKIPRKSPGKNWAKALGNRHLELKARRVKALDWKRHEKNTYEKITDWLEKIRSVLEDPRVVAENVYNMDETGVMLCNLSSVKVLVGRDDMRDYRGALVKRETVTAISWISF